MAKAKTDKPAKAPKTSKTDKLRETREAAATVPADTVPHKAKAKAAPKPAPAKRQPEIPGFERQVAHPDLEEQAASCVAAGERLSSARTEHTASMARMAELMRLHNVLKYPYRDGEDTRHFEFSAAKLRLVKAHAVEAGPDGDDE